MPVPMRSYNAIWSAPAPSASLGVLLNKFLANRRPLVSIASRSADMVEEMYQPIPDRQPQIPPRMLPLLVRYRAQNISNRFLI